MLGKDSLFTYQQIADEVKLTERTVRNHVPEIRLILNKFGLELRTTRGKGCEVLGAPVDRTILAGDIGRARSQNQYLFQMSVDWTREEDLHGLYP